MGVAQNMDCLIDLASNLKDRQDIGFVFVGRGSEVARLRERVEDENLSNTLFFDEIDSDEIPALYAQCKAGILTLDQRHRTHNIPGKLLTYLRSGLPVLAIVNPENDLIELLEDKKIGVAIGENNLSAINYGFNKITRMFEKDAELRFRCIAFAQKLFSSKQAVLLISSLFIEQVNSKCTGEL